MKIIVRSTLMIVALISITSLGYANNVSLKIISIPQKNKALPSFQKSVPLKAGEGCALDAHSMVTLLLTSGSAKYLQAAPKNGFYLASVGQSVNLLNQTKSKEAGILVSSNGVTVAKKLPPANIKKKCQKNTMYINTDMKKGVCIMSIGADGGLTYIHADSK